MRATRARTLAQSFGFALLRNGGWNSGTVLIKRAHAKTFGFRVHAYSAAANASFPFFLPRLDPHPAVTPPRSLPALLSSRPVRYGVTLVSLLTWITPKEIFVLYFDRWNRMAPSYITEGSYIFQRVNYHGNPKRSFLSLLLFIDDILLIDDAQL